MENIQLYQYQAEVVDVYDGDTCTVKFDLGFKIHFTEKVRLFGINTPEIRGEEREKGLVSRDKLRERILNKTVLIETDKDKKGKYGRYLGTIYIPKEDGNLECINDWLIAEGLAKKADY